MRVTWICTVEIGTVTKFTLHSAAHARHEGREALRLRTSRTTSLKVSAAWGIMRAAAGEDMMAD